MKIKICGLKYPDNIRAIAALSPDMIGLIFVQSSARFVESSVALMASLKEISVPKVGVFVNAELEEIRAKVKEFGLSYVQLHGDETPHMVEELAKEVKVIKAFSVDETFDFRVDAFKDVSYFLFDTKGRNRGGNGLKFDWSLLDRYEGDIPFLLSGGIGPSDIDELMKIEHAAFAGVDLNSGFESYPGMKKASEVKLFKRHYDEIYG